MNAGETIPVTVLGRESRGGQDAVLNDLELGGERSDGTARNGTARRRGGWPVLSVRPASG